MRLSGSFAGGLRACFPLPAPQDSVLLQPFAPDTVRTQAYFPGELIEAWIGKPLGGPFIWQYTAAVRHKSSGKFSDRGPALPVHQKLGYASIGAGMVDLDRDGDLDLTAEGLIWSNDGTGHFTQQTAFPYGVLGDIDGDSDLDVVGGTGVWLNDGGFIFRKTAAALGTVDALFDADGDGDLDAISYEYQSATNPAQLSLLRNDGSGSFAKAVLISLFRTNGLYGAAGADLDNDGDLDILANSQVFLNDGTGTFAEMNTGMPLGTSMTLGDVDGDGDLDVFGRTWVNVPGAFSASDYPDQVWLNDGNAHFTRGHAPLPGFSPGLAMGDLDGDGDLDAVVSRHELGFELGGQPSETLLNDGAGHFSPSGTMGGSGYQIPSLGDLDGDGDLDVVLGEWDGTVSDATLHVWLQNG